MSDAFIKAWHCTHRVYNGEGGKIDERGRRYYEVMKCTDGQEFAFGEWKHISNPDRQKRLLRIVPP